MHIYLNYLLNKVSLNKYFASKFFNEKIIY